MCLTKRNDSIHSGYSSQTSQSGKWRAHDPHNLNNRSSGLTGWVGCNDYADGTGPRSQEQILRFRSMPTHASTGSRSFTRYERQARTTMAVLTGDSGQHVPSSSKNITNTSHPGSTKHRGNHRLRIQAATVRHQDSRLYAWCLKLLSRSFRI